MKDSGGGSEDVVEVSKGSSNNLKDVKAGDDSGGKAAGVDSGGSAVDVVPVDDGGGGFGKGSLIRTG